MAFTCLCANITWFALLSTGTVIDFMLLPSLVCGTILAAVAAPYMTRIFPEKFWKYLIPLYCCGLSASSPQPGGEAERVSILTRHFRGGVIRPPPLGLELIWATACISFALSGKSSLILCSLRIKGDQGWLAICKRRMYFTGRRAPFVWMELLRGGHNVRQRRGRGWGKKKQ
jgi:hypothetical protein